MLILIKPFNKYSFGTLFTHLQNSMPLLDRSPSPFIGSALDCHRVVIADYIFIQ